MKKAYLLILIVFCVIFFIGIQEHNSKTFSPEKWESDVWERNKMIENLTSTHDLYGMHSTDIENLLGTNGIVEGSHYVYYIGKGLTGPILFSISFDENDYVSDYGLIVD